MAQSAPIAPVEQHAEPGTLGFLLHISRTNQGIRIQDLAASAGIDLFHYRCIERGQHIPSHEVRRRIAAALGLDDTPTTVKSDGTLVRLEPSGGATGESIADFLAAPSLPKVAAPVIAAAGPRARVAPVMPVSPRPTVRYHAIDGLTGPDLTARVNRDLQIIQQHQNASAGPHTPRTRGSVTSVTTVPTGQPDGVSVVIVYVADTDVFADERA
jgi:transcriptional regulator with XRE-family HTH domain